MKIRKPYDKHPRCFFNTTGPSLTHQSSMMECNINSIMSKFEKTGILEHRNSFEGQYGDYTDLPQSYHDSINAVMAAEEMFSSLPSKIRKRFHNDPGNFVEFVGNPDNSEELISLGLATRPYEDPVLETLPKGHLEPNPAPSPSPTEPNTSKSTSKSSE